MLQKSLQILIATVLAVLAAVVGYAALRFSGPTQSLDEAERLLQHGQYATAVAKLELAEKAPVLGADAQLRQRLWRLRAAANTQLGNAAKALVDVELLLADGLAGDETLQLDKVRLLALAGDSERALLAARAFLSEHPGHSRGLELAGEALQAVYQPRLRDLRLLIDRDLPAAAGPAAREALFRFLFRPDGDRAVDDAHDRLAGFYAREPRLSAAWQPVAAQLPGLRQQVQDALGFFQQSLEAGGQPVAAFRGFALALRQSERTDDLLAACEIQRRCFEHSYVEEAGAAAAWALYDQGLDEAVLATAARWLPKGAVARRLADGTLGSAAFDLLTCAGLAAHRLGRTAVLQQCSGDLWQIQRAAPRDDLGQVLIHALSQHRGNNSKNAEAALQNVFDRAVRAPAPFGRPDAVALAAPLLLGWLEQRAANDDECLKLLSAWRKARPAELSPHLALADFLLRRGRTAAARTALDDASALAPGDELVFERQLELYRKSVAGSAHDGPGLLLQCHTRGTLVPETTDPLGYILCAETALSQRAFVVAAASANRASQLLPSARAPRLLQARIALANGDPAAAVQALDRLLQVLPPDAATAQLELAARRAAGSPMQAALARALPRMPPDAGLQAELLREALRDAPARARPFVTPLLTATNAPAEHRALAAEALAHAGEAAAARALLQQLATATPPPGPELRLDLARAFAATVQAEASTRADDDAFAAAAGRLLYTLQLDSAVTAPPLLAAARSLASSHPRLAGGLLEHALAIAAPADRDGATFALAGELNLAAGRPCAAEHHWLAALAFADGRIAAEPLARACLADGRIERALQVLLLTPAPTDAALTARLLGLPFAAGCVAQAFAAEPADLLAHGVMATFGQPSMLDWQPAAEAAQQERLELLSLLREPAFAGEALRRLRAMIADGAHGTTEQLLLARALAASGDGAAAAAQHAALLQAGVRTPVFWHEVALAAKSPGYQLGEAMRRELFLPDTIAALAVTPSTLAFAMNTIADAFAAGGYTGEAAQTRLSLWQQAPTTCRLTAADLVTMQRDLPPTTVFALLDQALLGPTPPPTAPTLETMFAAARTIVTAAPDRAPPLVLRALDLLQAHGAVGCIVHFLFDHQGEDQSPAAVMLRRNALYGHLDRVAAGREDPTWLAATVRRLLADGGADTLLARLDELLAAHPSALVLWQVRATIAAVTPDAAQAIDELRHVLRHADDPAATLAMLTTAAEYACLVDGDAETLTGLPAALRAGADGQLATALVRLRQGNPDAALDAFAMTGVTQTPHQRLLHALAWLQSSRPDSLERARSALLDLARDYPSSSAARYTGSFARQLAPR
ncbi:MAG: hypothetical protein JNN13_09495 [Planctomycetes bacterium]|nr:hypothetical protein [Planctomycetota bacterium]